MDGGVVLKFGVESNRELFQVPFLVTSEPISKPVIGYNTIDHLVTTFEHKIDVSSSLTKILRGLSIENAESMVNIISVGGKFCETVWDAKLAKTQKVLSGSIENITCKLKGFNFNNSYNKPVIFSPLEEICLGNELVIFETVELIKKERKFIDIFVYNPSPIM